jgi:hypothetical protein
MAKFIGFNDPYVSTTASTVMYMPWHRARETLAFTKWEMDKLLMTAGFKLAE